QNPSSPRLPNCVQKRFGVRKKLGWEFSSKSTPLLPHAVLPTNGLYLEPCESRNPLSPFPSDVLSPNKLPTDESRLNPLSLLPRTSFDLKKFPMATKRSNPSSPLSAATLSSKVFPSDRTMWKPSFLLFIALLLMKMLFVDCSMLNPFVKFITV